MLVRDKKIPSKVTLKQTLSPKAEKLVMLEGYMADDESRAMDEAVIKLLMDSKSVVKAVFILTELFAKNTTNLTVTQMKSLVEQGLCTGCGIAVDEVDKKVLFAFTAKGTKFFTIMFGKNNSPRVLSKREVDGYALIKYALLDEVLM